VIAKLKLRFARSRYLRDVAWQMSGNGLGQVLGIVAMPLFTRLYSPSHFATVAIFAQVVAGLAIFFTWRLEYLVMLPKDTSDAHMMLRFISWIGALFALFAIIIAWVSGDTLAALLGDATLEQWLPLAPLAAWLFCVSVGLQHMVQRLEDFRNTGLSEVIGKAGYITSALVGVVFLPSVGGLLVSAMVGSGAKCLWLARVFQSSNIAISQPLATRIKSAVMPHLRLAGSMTFATLLSFVSGAAPLIYMAKAHGHESMGQFGLVISTLYLPSSLIGNAIGQVYYQRAAQQYSNGQPIYKLWHDTAWHLARIGIPIYSVIAILAPWAYPIFFGEQWSSAGEYARLMAVAAGMSFLSTPLDKTSLVVQAWWYQIVWNIARTLTILAVIWMSEVFKWDIYQYLLAIVIQMCGMYLIDWISSMRFAAAKSRPKNEK
jgi:teichuronic acid exporter